MIFSELSHNIATTSLLKSINVISLQQKVHFQQTAISMQPIVSHCDKVGTMCLCLMGIKLGVKITGKVVDIDK